MEDGEADSSNQEIFPSSSSMESFIEELLKDTHTNACTHIHTCNPPGPDNSHTHTCFHVHTKLVSPATEANDDSSESVEKKTEKRPLGNREAVRKYRQKKKARAASLEDEVVRLKAVYHQLSKRLQVQSALEAEIARLKCLLVDIRGRIEGEIGSFPYKNTVADPTLPGSYAMNPCDVVQCANEVYCHHNGAEDQIGDVLFSAQGLISSSDFETFAGSGPCIGNLASTANSFGASQRKGANDEAVTG